MHPRDHAAEAVAILAAERQDAGTVALAQAHALTSLALTLSGWDTTGHRLGVNVNGGVAVYPEGA